MGLSKLRLAQPDALVMPAEQSCDVVLGLQT
jgi:hypothetical protein